MSGRIIKRYETIRRITLTGAMDARSEAFAYCERNGYRVLRSGAMPAGPGRVDPKRFKVVAEKPICARTPEP